MSIRGRLWLSLLAGSVLSTGAFAQSGTWLADLTDSGDGDGLIEPGESAIVAFSIDLTPDVGTEIEPGLRVNNFTAVRPQVSAGMNLDSGASAVTWVNENFSAGHDILIRPDGSVEFSLPLFNSFQIPDTRDPVPIFALWWTPLGYTPRDVAFLMEAVEYESTIGDGMMRVAYNQWPDSTFADWPIADAAFSFLVVPAPSTAAAIGLAWAIASRRRRPAEA